MHKVKINLVTFKDVQEFIEIVTPLPGSIVLEDPDNGFKINAKSLLGAMASIEWDNIFVISDEDIYTAIKKFAE